MKVLEIVKCSDDRRWYADHVGQRVPFLGEEGDHYEYRSLDTGGYINFVLKEDAVIVDE